MEIHQEQLIKGIAENDPEGVMKNIKQLKFSDGSVKIEKGRFEVRDETGKMVFLLDPHD